MLRLRLLRLRSATEGKRENASIMLLVESLAEFDVRAEITNDGATV